MMRSRMPLIALVFMFVSAVAAQAATLRTAPFPSIHVNAGAAGCYVTNAGTTSATFTSVTLYNANGQFLESLAPVALAAHSSAYLPFINLADESPTHCVCVVPSAATWRCAFTFVNGDNTVTVIGAP